MRNLNSLSVGYYFGIDYFGGGLEVGLGLGWRRSLKDCAKMLVDMLL